LDLIACRRLDNLGRSSSPPCEGGLLHINSIFCGGLSPRVNQLIRGKRASAGKREGAA